MATFIEEVQERIKGKPILVVVDTLARCIGNSDENSTKDMGVFVEALDHIKNELDCHVMVVHHKPKNSDTSRGSVALPGAVDTMIEINYDKEVNQVKVSCEKQKDFEPFSPRLYRLEKVEDTESCVLVESETTYVESMREPQIKCLEALYELDEGATSTIWSDAFMENGGSERSFFRAKEKLEELRLVEKTGGKRGAKYSITPKGIHRIGKTPKYPCNRCGEVNRTWDDTMRDFLCITCYQRDTMGTGTRNNNNIIPMYG